MRGEIVLMRAGIGLLSVLLVLLQARLWVSDDGYREVARLGTLITEQTAENARLAQRNQRLEAEVVELRKGDTAVEERARADLGLIGPDETFYLFGGARPTG
ncbi:MAG: septum formation initiator family protein [Gammaproteobacteria bacterium]|nr:septum formation initiator family protein [Gammaproteobacteria bacterium]